MFPVLKLSRRKKPIVGECSRRAGALARYAFQVTKTAYADGRVCSRFFAAAVS